MTSEPTIQALIEGKLSTHLDLEHLQVINESAKHNVPPGSESHFKVVMVASSFDGRRLLDFRWLPSPRCTSRRTYPS